MKQGFRDLQNFVDSQHQSLINKGKIIIPLALGELYKDQILEKWLRRK